MNTWSFTKNRLHTTSPWNNNRLCHRLHHCHLQERPEALLKMNYHIMEMEAGSVTGSIVPFTIRTWSFTKSRTDSFIDSITTICTRNLKLYQKHTITAWRFRGSICSVSNGNSSVLNGKLVLWEDSSRSPVSSSNVPFWDYPCLNVRSLWVFQVDHTFYKLDVKILAASNEIRCLRCSRLTCYHEL